MLSFAKHVLFVALFGLSFAPEVDPPADRQDLFIEAVQNGDVKVVEFAIRFGMEVDAPGKFNVTPLMQAAQHGHTGVANLLIKEKANINKTSRDSETALHFAAQFGHEDVARLLLNSNASIDLKDVNGDTALHNATSKSHVDMVKLLLEEKANKFIKNDEGLNPFQNARGLNAKIDAMLRDISMPDDWTMTPSVTAALWHAIRNPPAEGVCVRMIVHSGAGDHGGEGSVFSPFCCGKSLNTKRFEYKQNVLPCKMYQTKIWIRRTSEGYYTLRTWADCNVFDVTEIGFGFDPIIEFESVNRDNRNHLWEIERCLWHGYDDILVTFYNPRTKSRLFSSYPALYTKYWNNNKSQGYHRGTTFKLIACREHLDQLAYF